ncbi:MAG: Gx transporter family protein [Clostridiales bacterium]|nr:Gx transporter family protein [Clostridiales bacterium]
MPSRVKTPTEKLAVTSMMIALSFAFGFLENLIPLSVGIPGVKLGLANIPVMITLYMFGTVYAIPVLIVRIVLAAATFGNASSFVFSLTGGILSFIVMCILKRTGFSITGVSMGGAVTHNMGQLAAAAIVTGTNGLIYYLPVLLISGLVAGAINGMLTGAIISRISTKTN